MYYDEFSLKEYGEGVKKTGNKNYSFIHNDFEYGKAFSYSKIEIVYRNEKEDKIISLVQDCGEKNETFKHLYVKFIKNISKYSREAFENFLNIRDAEKFSVYSEAEYNNFTESKIRTLRANQGQLTVGGRNYYAATNLNVCEYFNCIYSRVPNDQRQNIVFKFYKIAENYELIENNGIWSVELDITKEQWKEFLLHSDLTEHMYTFLKRWYIQPNQTGSCSEIYYGLYQETNFPISEIVGFGRRVLKYLKLDIKIRNHDDKQNRSRFWPITFDGYASLSSLDNKPVWVYIMKPELVAAIKELDVEPFRSWNEIKNNPSSWNKTMLEKDVKNIQHLISNIKKIDNTVTEAIVKARIGQTQYRRLLLDKYNHQCCICGIKNESLLIASHIKPWCDCNDEERLDWDNGLLLCANHDALFDKHLITVEKDGSINVSPYISENDKSLLNIPAKVNVQIDEGSEKYLTHHRKKFKMLAEEFDKNSNK